MEMSEKELVKKLCLIKYHIHAAAEVYGGADLHEAQQKINHLLEEFGVSVPYYLPDSWMLEEDDKNDREK